MQVVRSPKKEDWPAVLARPISDTAAEESVVRSVLDAVKKDGDVALRRFTVEFDGVDIDDFCISEGEFAAAENRVPPELKSAINMAKANIERFHLAQRDDVHKIETMPGVVCWRKSVAIEKIGIYIPAGTAPLFSTVLMLAIPAMIAGCREIILCSPPDESGKIADAVLYSARLCGVTRAFKVGGAQAVGALAFGTETIPKVYKIFGPGNRFVTLAKQIVSQGDVAIDMPAGPSEVAIIADESCVPAFVAADLLSQAEHGVDSQVMLVSASERVIAETNAEITRQIADLPRREIAEKALASSRAILVENTEIAIDILNYYAAEHLILAVENDEEIAGRIVNAGSIFLGKYSCESAGDYASGTNHTLPTGGFAKAYSGVSLDSFVKKITFQKLSADGIRSLGPAIEIMAAAEGLAAHKNAITLRLREIDGI